ERQLGRECRVAGSAVRARLPRWLARASSREGYHSHRRMRSVCGPAAQGALALLVRTRLAFPQAGLVERRCNVRCRGRWCEASSSEAPLKRSELRLATRPATNVLEDGHAERAVSS